MAKINNPITYGEEIMSWDAPEYELHEKTRRWYIGAIAVAIALLLFSFFTGNFLFAVIIIVAALVIILREGREPDRVRILITSEGIVVGRKFYDYDEIKDFSIIYKPRLGVKNLYFEFKSIMQPRLSIPLGDLNPLPIRQSLLKYLSEDLERTDQPLSEFLAKLFKL